MDKNDVHRCYAAVCSAISKLKILFPPSGEKANMTRFQPMKMNFKVGKMARENGTQK